jgi:hypothetical protein
MRPTTGREKYCKQLRRCIFMILAPCVYHRSHCVLIGRGGSGVRCLDRCKGCTGRLCQPYRHCAGRQTTMQCEGGRRARTRMCARTYAGVAPSSHMIARPLSGNATGCPGGHALPALFASPRREAWWLRGPRRVARKDSAGSLRRRPLFDATRAAGALRWSGQLRTGRHRLRIFGRNFSGAPRALIGRQIGTVQQRAVAAGIPVVVAR